jgi:tRNA pseudouridine32 synthase / 23S rRNA pseudouridine746 synthase
MARFRPNPPPTRNGVSASCTVLPPEPWPNVCEFLISRFPHIGADTWRERLANGDVVDDHGHPITVQSPYEAGLRVYYFRDVPQEAPIPFHEVVLHHDAHLLVVDKPHFLPVMPSGKYLQETVLVRLKKKLGLNDIAPIHRIDRDTAGLVMFSLNPATRDTYHALFRQRQVQKTYEAIAPWNAALPWPISGSKNEILRRESRIAESAHFMQQCEVDGTVNAITDIRLLEVWGDLARYELKPLTGQRHQLRVHMNALGVPILNDGIYPVLTPEGSTNFNKPLQLLAKSIAFIDPISSQPCEFVSNRKLQLGTMSSD